MVAPSFDQCKDNLNIVVSLALIVVITLRLSDNNCGLLSANL